MHRNIANLLSLHYGYAHPNAVAHLIALYETHRALSLLQCIEPVGNLIAEKDARIAELQERLFTVASSE